MFYKKIILSILIPLLFFSLLEGILRISNIEINTGEGPIPKNIFHFKVTNKQSQIDRDWYIETGPLIHNLFSRAYRCRYTTFKKEQGEYRIVVLGDSCTYGLGVDKSYSYYLEDILNKSNKHMHFKVFNFGFPGYSSFQGLLFLERYAAQLKPDCVIAWFGANDGCFAPFYTDKQFYYTQGIRSKIIRIHNFLYKHSKLYRLIRNFNLNYFRSLVDESFNHPSGENFSRVRVSSSEFFDNLNKLKEICTVNNCDIIFLKHCWYINKRLEKIRPYRTPEPYIDLYQVYKSGKEKPGRYFIDHVHPSKSGHQLIADRIAKEILKIVNGN